MSDHGKALRRYFEALSGERQALHEQMGPWDRLLMASAETAGEWEALTEMPLPRAAKWVVERRLTPSG